MGMIADWLATGVTEPPRQEPEERRSGVEQQTGDRERQREITRERYRDGQSDTEVS